MFVAALFLGATHATAVVLVWRQAANLTPLVIGAVLAVFAATVVLVASSMLPMYLVGWITVLPLVTVGLGAVSVACRRGGGSRAKGLIVGHSTALSAIGLAAFFFSSGRNIDYGAASLLFSSLLLLPILLAVLTLQNIWSWDDAFPRTISHARPDVNSGSHPNSAAPTESAGVVFIEDEDAMEQAPG